MFYHLFYPLSKYFFIFNLARYITFRGASAFVTSFILVIFFWKKTERRLKTLKIEEKVDMYGHVRLTTLHGVKEGTPTMGGLLIVFSVFLSCLLWSRWDIKFTWYALLVMFLLGLVGLKDDLLKIKRGRGIKRSEKLFYQILIGLILGLILSVDKSISTVLDIPFFKQLVWNLSYFYIFWVSLVIVSTSNAVNFTDGLDGLAIGAVVTNCLVFAILSYIVGHVKFAQYLFIPYVKGAGELSILCTSMIGAGLGFLWFNSYPAQIFMGDVGALSLGGVIGAVAIFIKKEFILIFSGGIFVLEALTVVIQIFSVKIRGKKVFKAAPLHHHLQLLGWPESKIVVRLWIVCIMFAVLSLLTLKLR